MTREWAGMIYHHTFVREAIGQTRDGVSGGIYIVFISDTLGIEVHKVTNNRTDRSRIDVLHEGFQV